MKNGYKYACLPNPKMQNPIYDDYFLHIQKTESIEIQLSDFVRNLINHFLKEPKHLLCNDHESIVLHHM